MMKKILVILSLFVASNLSAQKTYNITETRLSSVKTHGPGKIERTPLTITISDNLFTTTSEEKAFSYQIIKKVNEKNFMISDGLNEYNITIGEAKINNHSGFISQELEEGVLTYFF